ncbi:hypothetical protein A8144_08370 [Mycobacterium leprae 3125609]|nr:hypothetical protein A8144_08370 [Mycobacterium leprae 3125609]OAX71123.1 hypothetical protein A3216_07740 [Mycobacterium leprae 7935681]
MNDKAMQAVRTQLHGNGCTPVAVMGTVAVVAKEHHEHLLSRHDTFQRLIRCGQICQRSRIRAEMDR